MADLNKCWSRRLRRTHGGIMLCASGSVQIHGYASRHNHRGVVAEVQLARNAEDQGQRGKQNEKRNPASLQTEASSGEPEWTHGIALNHRGMAVDAVHRKSEEQGAAGLPAEVEPPA